MSTKATIAHGEGFHFYHECFDDDHVYLELEGAEFEATRASVTVRIPADVWEAIRGLAPVELKTASMTNAEIRSTVEEEVDGRIARCEKFKAEHPNRESLMRFGGMLAYGTADETRRMQIANGLRYFRRERARQRSIVERLKGHKVCDR